MNILDKKLANQYWKLAFHIEKAIHGEIYLDSPTVSETKILTSTDQFFKDAASNMDKIVYEMNNLEKKTLKSIDDEVTHLVSKGADKSVKNHVMKTYFRENLESLIKRKESTSFCPACSNMYFENGENREECRVRPGKEYSVYNCVDFDDFKCMNWGVYHSQIDQDILITKSILNELGEKHNPGKPDFRIQKALEKYISKLK